MIIKNIFNNPSIDSKKNFVQVSPLYYAVQNNWPDMAVSLHKHSPDHFNINETHNNINLLSMFIKKSTGGKTQKQYYQTHEPNPEDKSKFKNYIDDYFIQNFSNYDLVDDETSINEKTILYFYKQGALIENNNYSIIKDAITNIGDFNNFLAIVFEDIGWENINKINIPDDEGNLYPIIHWLNAYGFHQHYPLIKKMKEEGCDLNLKDKQGKSTIFYSDNSKSVDFFIENNVDLFVKNNSIINALEIGQNIYDNNDRHLALKKIKNTIKEKYQDLIPEKQTEINAIEILKNELIKDVSYTEFKKFLKASKPKNINKTIQTQYGDTTLIQTGILNTEERFLNTTTLSYYSQKKPDNILTNISFLLKHKSDIFNRNDKKLIDKGFSPDTVTSLIYILDFLNDHPRYNTIKIRKAFESLNSAIIKAAKKINNEKQSIDIEDYKKSIKHLIQNQDKNNNLMLYKIMLASGFFSHFNDLNEHLDIFNPILKKVLNFYEEQLEKEKNTHNLKYDIEKNIDNALHISTYDNHLIIFDEINKNVNKYKINDFCDNTIKMLELSMKTSGKIDDLKLKQVTIALAQVFQHHTNINEEKLEKIKDIRESLIHIYFNEYNKYSLQNTKEEQEYARKSTEILDIYIKKQTLKNITSSSSNRKKIVL